MYKTKTNNHDILFLITKLRALRKRKNSTIGAKTGHKIITTASLTKFRTTTTF
jgi:hypothetical protein